MLQEEEGSYWHYLFCINCLQFKTWYMPCSSLYTVSPTVLSIYPVFPTPLLHHSFLISLPPFLSVYLSLHPSRSSPILYYSAPTLSGTSSLPSERRRPHDLPARDNKISSSVSTWYTCHWYKGSHTGFCLNITGLVTTTYRLRSRHLFQ